MPFNPKLHSYVIALNQDSREEDLALIADFYYGEVTELLGTWEGKPERSYQLSVNDTDGFAMSGCLRFCDQEAYLILDSRGAWLAYFKHMVRDCHPIFLGVLTQVPMKVVDCTYCPETKTYWKAVK